jgi:L-amino acid N-acyltransferase YncA
VGAQAEGAGAGSASGASATDAPQSTPAQITIASLSAADWPAAARIYAAGIASGNATFESAAPSWEQWSRGRAGYPGVLARGPHGDVLGWAALTPTSALPVYRGVAEVSIYVDPAVFRQGVGSVLLAALIEDSERAGFWTLEAGIFPENAGSIALHERLGFELVGLRRRIGQMPDGRWRDERLYERRSPSVGSDCDI